MILKMKKFRYLFTIVKRTTDNISHGGSSSDGGLDNDDNSMEDLPPKSQNDPSNPLNINPASSSTEPESSSK